ncbi:response regulator receiver domain protein (macronuclear) [Tetrahymena thermophila SB210]|uniref:Response regulator receiver domain protein n=1 Tax=Tetrahymena thermophila (strain SB210) TaxID=312017 RepID=I7LXZ3_TETTS|nr:response regulator receiver domain protein [Tetrahymena thermophila SB210]EAS07035.2 response regulator receiver domain protein [Tetrahymena thermophila SB210]|eukprot:XP_001027277.2 response regulator receiver domain protein [Tetrahymena thermophila SB210]
MKESSKQEIKNISQLINSYTLTLHGYLNEQYNSSTLQVIQKTYFQSFWFILFAQIILLVLVINDDYGMLSSGLLISCIAISLIGFIVNRKYHVIIPYFMLFQKVLFGVFSYFTIQSSTRQIDQINQYSENKQAYEQQDIQGIDDFDDSLLSFCTILSFLQLMIFMKMQNNFVLLAIGYVFTLLIVILSIQKNIYQNLVLLTTSIIVFFFIYSQEKNKRIQFLEGHKQSQDLQGYKNLLDAQIPTSIFVISQTPEIIAPEIDSKKTDSCSVQQQPFSLKNCKIQFANKVCLQEFNTYNREDLISVLDKIQIRNRCSMDSQQNGFDLGTGNTLLSNNYSKDYLENCKLHSNMQQNNYRNQKKDEENNIEFFQAHQIQVQNLNTPKQNIQIKNFNQLINCKSQNKLTNLEFEDSTNLQNQSKQLNFYNGKQSKVLNQIICYPEKNPFFKLTDSIKLASQANIRSRNGTLNGGASDQFKQQSGISVFSLKDAIVSIFSTKESQNKLQNDDQNEFENKKRNQTSQYKLKLEKLLNETRQQNTKKNKTIKLNKEKSEHLDKLVEQNQQFLSFQAKEIVHFQSCKYQKEQDLVGDKNKIQKLDNQKYYDIKLLDCQWDHQDSVMVVMNDISPQVIFQRQQEVNEYKEKIISSFTHNLKTPLNGIFTFLQTALQRAEDQEDIKSMIKLSYLLGKQQMLMINDIIDYSQMIKGELSLDMKQDKVQNLINEVVEIFQNQIEMKKNIKFLIVNELNENEIMCTDLQRLQQVIVNVLQNAIKFTFEGEIVFKIEKSESNILSFQISDTGLGIENQLLTQINNMQSLETTNYSHGIGLGLSISKMILQYLGPEKSFELDSIVGVGTKVKFNIYQNLSLYLKQIQYDILPIKDEESRHSFSNNKVQCINLEKITTLSKEPSDTSEQCKVTLPNSNIIKNEKLHLDQLKNTTLECFLENKNIIIVDDTPFNIKVLKCIFKDIPNLTIQEAFNGQECIDILLKNKQMQYDLIFMDVNMPVLDGLSATQIINDLISQNEILNVPVIIVTAYDLPIDKELQVGAKAHISKPIQKRNLIEALNKVFTQEE